jgi:uncharacterized damage-inducible protein DinB
MPMRMTDLFLAELERVPEGRNDWKPHQKSMPLGYLSHLVATMPDWVTMTIEQDELDIAPAGGAKPELAATNAALLSKFDRAVAGAKAALTKTDDAHLQRPWKLLAGGHVVSERPRHLMLRHGVLNHWVHHRGQLTVYLRLNDAKVPSIYGPTADEGRG